jgi:oligopeptide/dipeptide ABC transporter ATP-binding protein
MLNISNLTVSFHTDRDVIQVVNGVDMTVEQGQAIAIVGESGSGKSTAVTAIMRLLPKNAEVGGEISFQGQNLLDLSQKEMRKLRGRKISMIFQNPGAYLNPTKTIGQQMIEPLLYHHLATPSQAKRKAIDLLDKIGIADAEARFNNYPFEFSGGMLQRVMIGMALMGDPDLLIADEPTTALDVTVQAEILILLKKLQKERGMSLIFVTHDLAVAAQVSDDIYVLYGGQVLEHIPSNRLIQDHVHPYLRGLIRSIPRMDGPRGSLAFIPGQPINPAESQVSGCIFANRCDVRTTKCNERPQLTKIKDKHEAACWLVGMEVAK